MSNLVGLDAALNTKPEKKKLGGLNSLFGISEADAEIINIPIEELDYRHNHNWSPLSGLKEQMLMDSIRDIGIVQPCVVRPKEDIAYPITGNYELLAGNNRRRLAEKLGLKTVPCIVKRGLSEEEAESYVNNTNINRDWSEMRISEKAAIVASEYDVQKKRNVRSEVFKDIDNYISQMDNMEGDDEESGGVRDIAKDHNLGKSSIANYIRIHNNLCYSLKELLDKNAFSIKSGVQLSYLSDHHQDELASLLTPDVNDVCLYKCNEEKAKQLRVLEENGKLNLTIMPSILDGSQKKKTVGRPKAFKLDSKIIKKYFVQNEDDQTIGEIIEAALNMYFGKENEL